MKLYLEKEIEYIPDWNNNKDAEEPIKFILNNLTCLERDECIDMNLGMGGKETVKADFEKLFRKGVKKIEGLTINDKEVKTADAFLGQPGLYDLYMEVATRILILNTEINPKN